MRDGVQVVVIGGGSAGIGAARRLAEAGADYMLLEARPRLGGRAWTVAGEHPLDLGCGWLHSADANPWSSHAEAQGWEIDRTTPPWMRPSDQPGFPREEQVAFRAAFAEFHKRLEAAEDAPDQPASNLLEENQRWNVLIDAVSSYVNGVALGRLSTRDYALYDDTMVNWRLPAGYGSLIASAADGLDVVLDCPASEIDHGGRRITVRTPHGSIMADAAILTVSSALIAEGRPRLVPDLPDKREAAACLPLGLADKLFLGLDHAEEFEAESRLFGRIDTVGTAAYHVRPFGRPMIEVYFGGDLADDLETQSAKEGAGAFADFATWELTTLFGTDFGKRLKPLQLSQWRQDEFARGSYSYAVPGHHGDRAKVAAQVDGRIFFAGEACSTTRFSTAHGALITGRDAAEQAIAALRI